MINKNGLNYIIYIYNIIIIIYMIYFVYFNMEIIYVNKINRDKKCEMYIYMYI